MWESSSSWTRRAMRSSTERYFFEPGRGLQTTGGGLGQLLQWREVAQRMGIEIRYESKVSALSRQRAPHRRRARFRSGTRIRSFRPKPSSFAAAASKRARRCGHATWEPTPI